MSGYRELMRRKLLEQIYDRMSPEDKRTFVQLTMQNKSHEEIMQALQIQNQKLDQIRRSQSWLYDFGANVAGNAVWESLQWLGSRILRIL